jgi:hypothetical protein
MVKFAVSAITLIPPKSLGIDLEVIMHSYKDFWSAPEDFAKK